MPDTTQEADYLFKQSLKVGTTRSDIQFFSEPIRSVLPVWPEQIWADKALIPGVAPLLLPDAIDLSGTVQYKEKLPLTAQPGGMAFYSPLLKNAIPFNFDPAGSYNYNLYQSDGTTNIPFGLGDWVVDNASGLITFYGSIPAGMPPKISFYKYVGAFGATLSGAISTDANGVTAITDGANGINTVNKASASTGNVMYFREANGVTILDAANPPGGLSGVAPFGVIDNSANTTTFVAKLITLGTSNVTLVTFPSFNTNRQSYAATIMAHGTCTNGSVGEVFIKELKGCFCFPNAPLSIISNIGSREGGNLAINYVGNNFVAVLTGLATLDITWLVTVNYSQYRLPDI